jgi:hypothetical protein
MDFIEYKNNIDEYYSINYDKLSEISSNIQRKNLGTVEFNDTLVISSYEYLISSFDKNVGTVEDGKLESIVVNWMYKQVIWKGTKFKEEFIYKKELPIKSVADFSLLHIGDDEYTPYEIMDISEDIEDVLEEEYEHQQKISHVKAMVESLNYVDYKLYNLVFMDGYNNSGKLSRYTGIPRTTCWMLIRDLKLKLKYGYDT